MVMASCTFIVIWGLVVVREVAESCRVTRKRRRSQVSKSQHLATELEADSPGPADSDNSTASGSPRSRTTGPWPGTASTLVPGNSCRAQVFLKTIIHRV